MSSLAAAEGRAPHALYAVAVHHADDAIDHPAAAFTQGLRAAHAEGLDIVAAAGQPQAPGDEMAETFAVVRREAEAVVHRIEYILAGLRRSVAGSTVATARFDPSAVPATGRVAALAEFVECAADRLLALAGLAHDRGEYQAARLLQMSAAEQRACAGRLRACAGPGESPRA